MFSISISVAQLTASLMCLIVMSSSPVLGGSHHWSGPDPYTHAASADDAGRLSQSDSKCGKQTHLSHKTLPQFLQRQVLWSDDGKLQAHSKIFLWIQLKVTCLFYLSIYHLFWNVKGILLHLCDLSALFLSATLEEMDGGGCAHS